MTHSFFICKINSKFDFIYLSSIYIACIYKEFVLYIRIYIYIYIYIYINVYKYRRIYIRMSKDKISDSENAEFMETKA